jgi:hypothetical protein
MILTTYLSKERKRLTGAVKKTRRKTRKTDSHNKQTSLILQWQAMRLTYFQKQTYLN